MEFVKECRVMVERLSWDNLQSHKLSFQNSEMSLVNLQRLAIKKEMDYEEECNYDHLSKDDLINEVKTRDDRVTKLEAECNVLISNLEKERVKTTLTINKQRDEIERLNRVIKDLERRIQDLMEKSGIHQLDNNEYVKTERVENDLEINVQELPLPIVIHSVQGILDKEDIIQESLVFEPQYVAEVYNANTEIEIASINSENMGSIKQNTNPCVPKPNYDYSLPQSAPSRKIKVENQFEMSPDTNTESDSPREPLKNNININDFLLKSQSVSTEGDTEDNTTRLTEFRLPELNVETEKHLDENVEGDSLETALESDLDDNKSKNALTGAKETDRQNESMELFVDPSSLSVPVCVPEVERNPIELSEMPSVSIESDLPEVPIAVQHISSVSNSETLEGVAPKIPEGKTSSSRSEITEKLKKNRKTGFKYSTEYKRGLQRRIRKGKEGKRFKCEQCDYTCKHKCDFIKHQRIHSGEKPFKCHQCDFASTQKSSLNIHRRIHSGEKPFKCDQCDFASTRKCALTVHLGIHSGEKPFKCDWCEYRFSRKNDLKSHLLRLHSAEKPFKCDQCDYTSTMKSDLITHQRIHSDEKSFKCKECEYYSTDRGSLTKHLRVHSGEKPFNCDRCDFASTWKAHLITHERIHTGEKPFKCDQCEYACIRGDNLITHKRIHNGEKPFKCDRCDYGCTQMNNLIRHKLIHSGEKPLKCDRCDYECTQKTHLIEHKRRKHMCE